LRLVAPGETTARTLTHSHSILFQGNNLAGNYLFGNGDNPCPWNN